MLSHGMWLPPKCNLCIFKYCALKQRRLILNNLTHHTLYNLYIITVIIIMFVYVLLCLFFYYTHTHTHTHDL